MVLSGAYTIAGLDWWTGSVDWIAGLDWTELDWTGLHNFSSGASTCI